MPSSDPWPTIHAERKALAGDLESLTDTQWATPSLCGDWTVRQVLGHMAAAARTTQGGFLGKMIAAGFRFNAMSEKDVARETQGPPSETLARFKEQVNSSKHPPGPVDTWLGEALVHSEDIRRPLGISHSYPIGAVTRVADFYKGSNLLIGSKKRIDGLKLQATDADWSTGDGPEVAGPAMSLVMAMTGRQAALDDLSGEGVGTLKSRM